MYRFSTWFFIFISGANSKILKCTDDSNQLSVCQKIEHSADTPPFPPNNETLMIDTVIDLIDVSAVDENNFYYTMALQMTLSWPDDRLSIVGNIDSLVVPENVERFLWKPSTYIYDLKNLRHSISLQNDHTHFCKVYNSENMVRVSISDRFDVDITCGYNHTNFPFDTQFCLFRFGVQNYPIEKVRFARVTLHDFTADHDPAHQAQNTKLAFTKTIKPLGYKYFDFGRANYSYNGLSITFDRNIENYIYAYYGPLFLFVIMSWFSFVISFQQVPGRMGLLVTLFLILVNTYSSTLATAPPIKGSGLIGQWMIGCQSFIFAAMLEYGFVLFLAKFIFYEDLISRKLQVMIRKIDGWFLLLMPCFFLIFNAAFWMKVSYLDK